MIMSRRYYWLKLNQNFFDSPEIKVLRKMENGSDYIVFWQELLLSSLSYTEETQKIGLLVFKENIPWSQELMESVFGYSKEIIMGAMNIFKKLGMITITESGEIWANNFQEMIGSETTEALRKREYRAKTKSLEDSKADIVPTLSHNGTLSPRLSENCPVEIELEKDIDIETELEKEEEKIEEIKIEYSEKVFLTEKQFNTLIHDYGKNITISAIEILSNYKCSKNKKYESDYHALLTWAIKEAAGKDRQLVKAEKTAKDEERERKRKIEDDIEQGKMEKLPPGMTRGLIDGALKKSDFLNKKEDVDNGGANQREEPPWGVKE